MSIKEMAGAVRDELEDMCAKKEQGREWDRLQACRVLLARIVEGADAVELPMAAALADTSAQLESALASRDIFAGQLEAVEAEKVAAIEHAAMETAKRAAAEADKAAAHEEAAALRVERDALKGAKG